jgi:branched-chain amino acid aminotransferase
VNIAIQKSETSRRAGVDFSALPFGTIFSDHMLVADWSAGQWGEPRILPYGSIELAPSIKALQYGLSVFDGLKAHRDPDGRVLLFRPRDNARRLNRSAARLSMPPLPTPLFVDGLTELVRLDADWTPMPEQGSFYIRPCMFAVDEDLTVRPAEQVRFVIFTSPVGHYYAKPLELLATEEDVRAYPGGTGDVKPAGNYAPALRAVVEAQEQGFDSVLWLDGVERRYIEESGVMNVFFRLGERVVTPALTGSILAGIIRDSVITLLRDAGVTVVERLVSIDEICEAHKAGRLIECFGTGTAATIAPVRRIRYREHDMHLPDAEPSLAATTLQKLRNIATGRADDPYGWIVPV